MKLVTLVVEDDAELRKGIAEAISNDGHEALQAENGKIAFDIMNDRSVHVVLSDVRMPGGNGLELLSNIGTLANRPLVIMMSGYSDVSELEAKQKGAVALLEKPFNYKSLREILSNVLANGQLKPKSR